MATPSHAMRFEFLSAKRATVKYTQRRGENAPYCEVETEDWWIRRRTLEECVDTLIQAEGER